MKSFIDWLAATCECLSYVILFAVSLMVMVIGGLIIVSFGWIP